MPVWVLLPVVGNKCWGGVARPTITRVPHPSRCCLGGDFRQNITDGVISSGRVPRPSVVETHETVNLGAPF